jgi:hypothetical protein
VYKTTLKELKTVLKVSTQAGQGEAVKKTSLESTVQDDDFREVKTRKRHGFNNTSQTAKDSIKSTPTSAVVTLPQKHF